MKWIKVTNEKDKAPMYVNLEAFSALWTTKNGTTWMRYKSDNGSGIAVLETPEVIFGMARVPMGYMNAEV